MDAESGGPGSSKDAEPLSGKPFPFLKWAGGKRSLLGELWARLPERIGCYFEPFLGGGALFFALARHQRFERAVLNDRNPELIAVWRAVAKDPDGIAERFDAWPQNAETYYQVRALDWHNLEPQTLAARAIYLNRCGFNGLYRLNRQGGFNVPFGKQPLYHIDRENLRACAACLQSVEICCGDFEAIMARATPGDFVYCDPPYWPASPTARFTRYDGQSFGASEQQRLASAFRALKDRSVRGLLSNASVPDVHALYAGLPLDVVQVRRAINRDPQKRGAVGEVLVSL